MPKPRTDRPRQPRMIEEQRAMPAQVCFPNTAFEANLYLIYMRLGVVCRALRRGGGALGGGGPLDFYSKF